jgi:FlaA1/EpsC-like NDP-sugar epimerase
MERTAMLHKVHPRGLIVFAHDIFMAALSFVLSVYLRLDFWIFEYLSDTWLVAGALFTAIASVVFWSSGLYRGVWRYASLNDLWAITRAVSLAVVIFAFTMFIWVRLEPLPRSVLVIEWFVLMALLGGPRFFYRLLKDRQFGFERAAQPGERIPVLLAGAADGAEMFLRALRQSPDAPYRVVGILSEGAGRVGREIHGVQVVDTLENLDRAVARLKSEGAAPQRLILTKDDMDGQRVGELLDKAAALGLTLARLPKITDLKAGLSDKVEIKPVAVEDLLGRPQVPLDRDAMARLIGGRRVLVTGAGGSIGSELVRQVAALGPAALTLLDNSEYALYRIDLEVSESFPDIPRSAVIADVRDTVRLQDAFDTARPEVVFHAAALKHVPMVENNILEGVATNTLGTVNVADACRAHGARQMVLISTDKAVNPTSIMGATKRLAEIYCQARDLEARTGNDASAATRFVTVRFGNVLGSTGSVVPLFRRQLEHGGPLTVTHPDMRRYFMTIREAVELVLQAAALGAGETGGEVPPGNICVLDMGEPVKIIDLARQMVRLAGLKPEVDVKIEVVGLRPGEKLFEEIFHGSEPLMETSAPGILLAAPRAADINAIEQAVDRLGAACGGLDRSEALRVLHELVPEYAGEATDGKAAASG